MKIDYEYEIIMVDDCSQDDSFAKMKELADKDQNVRIFRLSRNFGSHAAILCGLEKSRGDCVAVKAADLQEPTELILEMVERWKQGNNVVLAIREGRDEGKKKTFFADTYYWIVRKTALNNMPEHGFDVYLIDRKVVDVLTVLDEKNSILTGQILWSGFKTAHVGYYRQAREIGESKWTLKKKIRLVSDTMFSFSMFPIKLVEMIGFFSIVGAIIWTVIEVVAKLTGKITVIGWVTSFIFNLLSFGVIMMTLGLMADI